MLDFQIAFITSEQIFVFAQRTYQGRIPPTDFFIEAWTRTSHAFCERLRLAPNGKLNIIVEAGSVWESHRTSYSPALALASGVHAGGFTGVDASPQNSAALRASRVLASAAQSQRDRGKGAHGSTWGAPTGKRSYGSGERQWEGGKSVSIGGDQAKGQGKKPYKKRSRWGKGNY